MESISLEASPAFSSCDPCLVTASVVSIPVLLRFVPMTY
jgi:hypothetical protein